jgi:hypothetical protein
LLKRWLSSWAWLVAVWTTAFVIGTIQKFLWCLSAAGRALGDMGRESAYTHKLSELPPGTSQTLCATQRKYKVIGYYYLRNNIQKLFSENFQEMSITVKHISQQKYPKHIFLLRKLLMGKIL